jgi:signal transduction histidine kinase
MGEPLRILMLEDSDDDELLVLSALREGGFEPQHTRVWSAEAMQRALPQADWELILSDYCMPGFDAPTALAIAKASKRDIPFIIVSGTVGEELAVDAMRAGAQDYVMKEALARLVPSVRREVNEARARNERRAADRAAKQAMLEKEKAEAIALAQGMFLANVSHELRTPLNAIIGFTELLDSGAAGPLTPKQAEYMGYVLSSGRYLLSLVSDLLDLSKAEAGKMALVREWVALGPVAEGAREMLQLLADKQGVQLILQVPDDLPELYADSLRLKQVLYNLLSNAIKFTPRGGTITLAAQQADDQLEISVTDTGVGIDREDLARLFREFEQLTTKRDERAFGSGLGLALSKKLVELHGGSIAAESERGVGSRFTLRLPIADLAALRAAADDVASAES